MKYRFPSVMFVFSLPISSLNRVTELLRNIIKTFRWIGHHRRGSWTEKQRSQEIGSLSIVGVTSPKVELHRISRGHRAAAICVFTGRSYDYASAQIQTVGTGYVPRDGVRFILLFGASRRKSRFAALYLHVLIQPLHTAQHDICLLFSIPAASARAPRRRCPRHCPSRQAQSLHAA